MKAAMKAAMKTAMKSGMKKAAMKAAKKPMKKAMKKAMKKSIIGKGKLGKALVLRGSREKTSGGLTKSQLMKNKRGKVVSKKASERARKNWASSALCKWVKAVAAARKE